MWQQEAIFYYVFIPQAFNLKSQLMIHNIRPSWTRACYLCCKKFQAETEAAKYKDTWDHSSFV